MYLKNTDWTRDATIYLKNMRKSVKTFEEYISEKLDIKPADLNNLLLLKKINNPKYEDLLVTGNVAVTGEDVYICIDGYDYDWTLSAQKIPLMVVPSDLYAGGYMCMYTECYKKYFPEHENDIRIHNIDGYKYRIKAVFKSGITADDLKTAKDLKRIYAEYKLDKGPDYIL